jgi:hypothetical protein
MTTPRKRGTRPKRLYTGPRPGYDDPRYKATREQLKRTGNNICHICGHTIDLQLKYPHPLSWSCDHLIPRSQLAPDDPRQWDIRAMAESHLRCNEARGAKPIKVRPAQGLNPSIDW